MQLGFEYPQPLTEKYRPRKIAEFRNGADDSMNRYQTALIVVLWSLFLAIFGIPAVVYVWGMIR